MVWYKSWLDTRWRFLIPLAILVVNICGLVFEYSHVANVLPTLHADGVGDGPLGRAIQEAIEAERTYNGFIWYQWFRQNLMQMGTVFAIFLGSGSLLSGATGGTTFTLSLPVSRNRWLAVRVVMGLAELLTLAVVPSLAIPWCPRSSASTTPSRSRSSTRPACSSFRPCSSAWRCCCPRSSPTRGGRCCLPPASPSWPA